MSKTMKPVNANTFEDICMLETANFTVDGFWMMKEEGCVTIGQGSTVITVPTQTFVTLERWLTS